MKILSFGDLHVGAGVDDDVEKAIRYIIFHAAEIMPDLIIITGDVYDGATDPSHRNLMADLIQRIARYCPIVIIRGNHDIPKDLSILGKLQAPHLISVVEYPSVMVIGDVAIHLLPWLTKASFIAQRVMPLDVGDNEASRSVSQLALLYLRGQIAKLEGEDDGGLKHLLYAHLMIAGSRLENYQPLIGEGVQFGYHDLVEAGFHGGAFGHIHIAQTFGSTGQPQFRYNGAVAAMNYGETALHKSFSVLDTDTMDVAVYQIEGVPRMTFDAEYDGKLNIQYPDGLLVCGGRVRVKLKVSEGYGSEDGKKLVREFFEKKEPLELKIEIQTKPRDLVRAAEIAAAKTAGDKMIAYWNATGTTPEEPLRTEMLTIVNQLELEITAGDLI